MSAAGRKTLAQLHRQAWSEIPEVMGSSVMAVLGIVFVGCAWKMYADKDGDNKRYRYEYTVYRPEDPRAKNIKE